MKFLLIGLLISLFIYTFKIYVWIKSVIYWMLMPKRPMINGLKKINQIAIIFIIDGIGYFIIFGSLLASLMLLF